MKITSVDIMMLEAEAPENRGRNTPVFCRIHTDEGIFGDGEAGVMMMTGARAACAMLEELSPSLIGQDPIDGEVLLEKLCRGTYFGPNGGPIFGAAVAALDTALRDIKGKSFGVPVYKLLGGKYRDELHCYASQINFGWGRLQQDAVTPEEFAACAREAAGQGYDAVKADFFVHDAEGRSLTEKERTGIIAEKYLGLIESRVAAVREALGSECTILMECHGYTDSSAFLQIAERTKKYGIAYAEEPAATAFPVLKKLGEKSGIPVSMGERLHSVREFLPFITNQTVSFVQPDIGNCRGITEARKIAQLCALYDVGIQFHCANSHLNVAATLQLEAAIPNFTLHEHCCVHERDYVRKLTKFDYQPVDGVLTVPEIPGIGNELSEYTLKRAEKKVVR